MFYPLNALCLHAKKHHTINEWNVNTICQLLPTLFCHYVLKIYLFNSTINDVYTLLKYAYIYTLLLIYNHIFYIYCYLHIIKD